MPIRATDHEGVFRDGSWLYTRNLVPGVSVYGEVLRTENGIEYRRWDANRSKLAAYLKKAGRTWPFRASTSILYLGAASGTTASHLSDVCTSGTIAAVEISPRSFRDLVTVAERRPNLLPILGDADRPDDYRGRVAPVDVVYQDVAQRNQVEIFLRNIGMVRPHGLGFLMFKARSSDVAASPGRLYRDAETRLRAADLRVVDVRTLDPFADDHAVFVVEA